jgi:hypothetical protein
VGAPLFRADAAGDSVVLAFHAAPGGLLATWSASFPNVFQLAPANDLASDLTISADGSFFAVRSNNTTEIRGADLTRLGTSTSAEIEQIPQRIAVPGVTLYPSGALVYEPFLDGPAPAAPPAIGIHGGIAIRDLHTGEHRLRIYLPEPLAMPNTDIDGLHGSFLTTDENGQRLFAITTSGLTVIQLAIVPLGIGTLLPAAGAASGSTAITIRAKASFGGNPAIARRNKHAQAKFAYTAIGTES